MSDEFKSLLDEILPDYASITKAPGLAELAQRANSRGCDLEDILRVERGNKYKAIDTATGSIYLICNPAAWFSDGQKYYRPKPEFQFKLGDAKKYSGAGSNKRKGSAGEAF